MPSLATFVWADVCSRLGLGDRAGEFYELLEPFSQPARGHGCLRVGREVALGLLVALQGGASRPRAQGIDPAAEIEERFGAPPWPRSAVLAQQTPLPVSPGFERVEGRRSRSWIGRDAVLCVGAGLWTLAATSGRASPPNTCRRDLRARLLRK
jgi:hypothetical protein